MPFKIIKTIEKGKEKLTIIPSGWEKNGILRWPGKNVPVKSLVKKENSKPLPDWAKMDCIVKRTSIATYSKAEEDLDVMLNHSDTDHPNNEERVEILHSPDYNTKAASLMAQQQPPIPDVENNDFHQDGLEHNVVGPAENSIFQIITNTDDIKQDDIDKVLENQKQILDNQKSIMDNQNLIHETQNNVNFKLERNSRQMSEMTVLIDESFKKLMNALDGSKNSSVVKLSEVNPIESEAFVIKPVSDANELNHLENYLSDKKQKQKMYLQFSLLCTKADGSGISCAYKLLDIMFTREFICQCSWSGGSKGQLVKIALKAYKNILNFFFGLINSWDSTYTHDMNEKFFKTILKNSGKRLEIKNLRTSTKRKRKETGTCNKRTKNEQATGTAKTEEKKTTTTVKETVEAVIEEDIAEKISENDNKDPEMADPDVQDQIIESKDDEEENNDAIENVDEGEKSKDNNQFIENADDEEDSLC